jgi:PAS domain S-box-containing protein
VGEDQSLTRGGSDWSLQVRSRSLFEACADCVELLDRDGVVRYLNSAGLAFRNQTHAVRVAGRPASEVVRPRHRAAYRRMAERALAGEAGCLAYEGMTADGRGLWLETQITPLQGPGDRVTSLLAVTRRLPGDRRSGAPQAGRLQPPGDPDLESVLLQDADGVVREVAAAGLSLLDAERPDNLLGREMNELVTPEYREQYRDLTCRVLRGERGAVEYEALTFSGRRRWMETHASPLFDGGGAVGAVFVVTRCIADRKSIEEGLRRQRSELAHACRLSTMGEMASGLAHELNQPLCAISSYAQSAQSLCGPADPAVQEILDKIVQEAERASQVIRGVRDFVRNQGTKRVSTPPSVMVEAAVQLVESERRRLNVNIQVQVAEGLPFVLADRIQIEQVLLNLLMNALQASQGLPWQERQLSITVALEPGDRVRFCLCNRGPSIPEDVAEHMFTPFYTTKEKGMGMGLPISRAIIEAHDGAMGHRHYAPGGACFFFDLPAEGP